MFKTEQFGSFRLHRKLDHMLFNLLGEDGGDQFISDFRSRVAADAPSKFALVAIPQRSSGSDLVSMTSAVAMRARHLPPQEFDSLAECGGRGGVEIVFYAALGSVVLASLTG
jgi:hypothetical protein